MLEYWKTHEQFVSKPEYLFLRKQKKQKYVHMGLDKLLFTLKDNDKIIAEIKDFTYDEVDEHFTFCFPQLFNTVKWKFDYIVFKREATKNNLNV